MSWPPGYFNRPVKQVLLDLIYRTNKYRVDEEDFEYGRAREVDQHPDIQSDENAFVPAKILNNVDERFRGKNGFLYRRTPLNEVLENKVVDDLVFPFNVYDILNKINQQHGLNLTKDDVYNDRFTTMQTHFELRAKAHSTLWTGKAQVRAMGEMIPVKYLSGFTKFVIPA